jgi:hypothetical protein
MRYCAIIVFFLFFAAFSSAPAVRADALDQGLANLARWWPGDWSNESQVTSAHNQALPEAERHRRMDMIVRAVDLPQFGAQVFYAEIFADGDPAKIVRQRLYAAEIDRARGILRVRLFILPDQNRLFPRAYENTSVLAALKPTDVIVIPGCDLYFQPEPDALLGGMDFGACRYEAFPEFKAQGVAELISYTRMQIAADRFWNSDALYSSATQKRVGQVRDGGTFQRFERSKK